MRVVHYLIRINVTLAALEQNTSIAEGDLIAFVVPTDERTLGEDRLKSAKRRKRESGKIILDCRDIDVRSCSVVKGYEREYLESFIGSFCERTKRREMQKWFELPSEDVSFATMPWSLDIACGSTASPLVLRVKGGNSIALNQFGPRFGPFFGPFLKFSGPFLKVFTEMSEISSS